MNNQHQHQQHRHVSDDDDDDERDDDPGASDEDSDVDSEDDSSGEEEEVEGLFTVTVLPGYSQGMTMRFRTPKGTVCTVQIPEGINAGDSFRVAVPEEGSTPNL